jgi:hypothetical protein
MTPDTRDSTTSDDSRRRFEVGDSIGSILPESSPPGTPTKAAILRAPNIRYCARRQAQAESGSRPRFGTLAPGWKGLGRCSVPCGSRNAEERCDPPRSS